MDCNTHKSFLEGMPSGFKVGLLVFGFICSVRGQTAQEDVVDFQGVIKPMLSERCFGCHGPDASEHGQAAGLRLDHFEGATQKLASGKRAVVPHDADASELIRRIVDVDDPMPPVKSHKAMLTDEEVLAFRQWVSAGAVYEAHWSFKPLIRPEVPTVGSEKHPVDQFVYHTLKQVGVKPAPRADPLTLIRRLALDLTGLPPNEALRDTFLANPSDKIMNRAMEMLFKSERHAEHQANWWLDLVRYSDSIGFHSDNPRIMWLYREWVINAFLENMSFDAFSTWQLAGDFLIGKKGIDTNQAVIASSYNRLQPITEEAGAQPKEYEVISMVDRVGNFGNVWLGLTTGCAQCHNHKFDPIKQRDFYSLGSFFADIDENPIYTKRDGYQDGSYLDRKIPYGKRGGYRPYQRIASPEQQAQRDALDKRVESADGADRKKRVAEREKFEETLPIANGVEHLETPRTVRVLHRGDWMDESGEVVLPSPPAFLGGWPLGKGATRLDLAQWLFHPDQPMVARVMANRLWARYFGKGLSRDLVDLGAQGDPPSHPELLDWLACELRDSGWDLQHVERLILTSKTWKMSSNNRPELQDTDPDNRWLSRQNPIRLSAEAVRDQALLLGGILEERIGGESVFPYQPEGHWAPLNFPKRTYPNSKGGDLYRRSLYTWFQRTFPNPELTIMDAPRRESCTAKRDVSNTPLQALMVLNSPTHVEAARLLAARVLTEAGSSDKQRLLWLGKEVWGRTLDNEERMILFDLLKGQRKAFADSTEQALALVSTGEAPVPEGLDVIQHAAWTQVCRAVLNAHETLVRR